MYHFIGIKGAGMSALAVIMKNLDETIEEVRKLKIKFQNRGCSYESFLSFLIHNANFLMENENISNRKLLRRDCRSGRRGW